MAIKRGNEATFTKNSSEKVKMKDVRLSLKQDESVKVIICTDEDYVQVPSHNDFNMKVFPQACHKEDGIGDCPLCAVAALGEDYKGLKVKDRYKFAFYVPEQNKIMVFDATAGQAKKLKSQIKEYAEDITQFGAIFTFKRTGTGKETDYSLSLISERKYTAADKKAIEEYKGYEISNEFFEDISSPVSLKFVYKTLEENTDVDVRGMFPDAAALLDEAAENTVETQDLAGNSDLPFNP